MDLAFIHYVIFIQINSANVGLGKKNPTQLKIGQQKFWRKWQVIW